MTNKKFQRQTIQDALGHGQATFFGVNIYESLFLNKRWIVFLLSSPYFMQAFDPINPPAMVDVFSELTDEELYALKNQAGTLFMFNFTWEGNSHIEYNFYQMLTCSAVRHDIPLHKIFFVSSNLKEEESYDVWQKLYMPDYRINVISFDFFSDWTKNQLDYLQYYTIDYAVDKIKQDQKLFLSMNRRKRTYRVYTVYKIFASRILQNSMISYDRLETHYLDQLAHRGVPINQEIYKHLIDSSPSVLDFNDFEVNWAGWPAEAAMPNRLFEKSLVSLVSETLFDNYNGTSLFYSEKSFKPMIYYHPVMIFGQPGLNTSLERIGFKPYNNYFDLSFDTIEDHTTRVDTQIAQLELLNDRLAVMSIDQKVEWVLQDRSTLEHNKEALRAQDFNKKKLQILVNMVRRVTE